MKKLTEYKQKEADEIKKSQNKSKSKNSRFNM